MARCPRQHRAWGERILGDGAGFETARRIVRWHREAFDGTSSPDGLRGEAIPLEARIVRPRRRVRCDGQGATVRRADDRGRSSHPVDRSAAPAHARPGARTDLEPTELPRPLWPSGRALAAPENLPSLYDRFVELGGIAMVGPAGDQDAREWRPIAERARWSSVLATPTRAFHGTGPGGDLGPA
jgi:hypothetical protein